ncbi:polyketide synthase [Streptomyces sp. b94]|uniref:beta-ketoacyl [acyl carrier protein] synthase domain-containing protein n=1 Tax=Streptomyces sp. b94 TaxID=1827634 RepID=UPI001B378E05|nr:polyketide synthase [Streptomyces sp. b94]
MDHRDILIRFKNGDLGREQAAALLTGAAPGPGPATAPRTTAVAEPRAAVSEPPPARALTTAPAGGGLPAPVDGYAITAVHGRFPDADGLDAFWHSAVLGRRDGTRQTSGAGEEIPVAGEGHRDGADGRRTGRSLGGVDAFDAVFFGLTPRDAALMDPQERLLLEVLWQTLETAGCTGARLDTLTAADGEPRGVGVYVAHGPVGRSLTPHVSAGHDPAGHDPATAGPRAVPSAGCCAGAGLPARLSTLLDLRGPGHCVGGGEASFLVALHQALSALRAGECGAALVGAVDLRLDPSRRHPEGGEGVGAVLLRPLAAAQAAGDTVHAVVRATAVAHPGRRAPAAVAGRLARRALTAAGVTADDVALRETEATAAATTGDTGAATGLAALLRAVLQLRHGTLLPAAGGSSAVPWGRPYDASGRELPRRATVAVHPTAGTAAAHALLEEAPPREPGPVATGPTGPASASGEEELVLLSAPTPEHLAATARLFADEAHPADGVRNGVPAGPHDDRPELAALARELRLGRAVRECRLAVVVRNTGELAAALRAFADDPERAGTGGPDAGVRYADLRGAQGPGVLSGDLPETRAYLAALWRGRRLDALARLWLAGVDVTAADAADAAAPVLPLPTSALLRRPLREAGRPRKDEPKPS